MAGELLDQAEAVEAARRVFGRLLDPEASHDPAERARFPGSPTVRVDGRDVEPGSEPPAEYAPACRLYRLEHHFAGQPDERWIREALLRAAGRT